MARLIGDGIGVNCSLEFFEFTAAEREREWLGGGGSRVSTRKLPSDRKTGPPKKFYLPGHKYGI
jgi:hypothetical protein